MIYAFESITIVEFGTVSRIESGLGTWVNFEMNKFSLRLTFWGIYLSRESWGRRKVVVVEIATCDANNRQLMSSRSSILLSSIVDDF